MDKISRRRFLTALSASAMVVPLASCVSNQCADTDTKARKDDLFSFAVVSDRTGGYQETGIFSYALSLINDKRPSFVLSVGDLVEGEVEDIKSCSQEWDEVSEMTGKLDMPFYFAPGNHDLHNDIGKKYYDENIGKRYYHFVYNNTLFIFLSNAEEYLSGHLDWYGQIDDKQMLWLEKTIKENSGVAWTFIVMHKPMFFIPQDNIISNDGWTILRNALGTGNNFTVLTGHLHSYYKLQIDGIDCYTLSATGGRRLGGKDEQYFHHFMWIVMTKDGPRITNTKLIGAYGDDPVSEEDGRPNFEQFYEQEYL